MLKLRGGKAPRSSTRATERRWRGAFAAWAFVGALAAGAAWAEDPGFPGPNGDPSVLPAGAKLDRVFGGACALTEGVATSPQGMVYFSDITFTTLCKDASGKFAAGRQHLAIRPKDQTGHDLPLAERHVERNEV